MHHTTTSPPASPPSPSPPLPTLSSTNPISALPTIPPSLPSPLRHPLRATQKLSQITHIRAAKCELLSHIREDWTYPPHPASPSQKRSTSIDTQWRERESDSSLCPSPTLEAQGLGADTEEKNGERDPYRFENPESLGEVKESRSRKRKRAIREELCYNTGLQTFLHRRDAWTGAVSMPASPPASTSPAPSADGPSQSAPHPEPFALNPPTLLPLPPPLIPDSNPIRAAITPATYPSIYSKIVVQGLAPTIPVNLTDVVRAMVDGWKTDGEWPPRSRCGEEETVGKRVGEEGKVRRGVRRVGRALGMREREEGDDDG